MNQSQIAIRVDARPEEIARKQTLGAAIELCAELGGFALDKSLQQELRVDKAQFSRWLSGAEGIVWPKFMQLMDTCGNDAPLLWMLHQRGYDLNSLRQLETETEKLLRRERDASEKLLKKERDEKAAMEIELRFARSLLQGRVAA